MSIDVMKQALAALEMYLRLDTVEDSILLEQVIAPAAVAELRDAIEQEPRQWQGLTAAEIHECWPGINVMDVSGHFYRNIEAKLREKNT